VLVKIFGLLILIFCFGSAIALIITLVMFLGFGEARNAHLFPFSIVEYHHAELIYIAAFLTAFIPVIMIIFLVLSGIFGTKSISRSSGTTLLVVWICALCAFVYYAVEAASDFRTRASFTEIVKITPTSDNVYHLKLNDIKYLTHEDSVRLNINDRFHNLIIKNDNNDAEPRNVNINIVQSDGKTPEMEEEFSAQGGDYESALMNARNTSYQFTQKDSVLQFDSRLIRKTGESWHAEEIDITLKLPLNAKVIVDQDLNDHVGMNGLSVYDCKETNKVDKATSSIFVITNDGPQCKVDTIIPTKAASQEDSLRKLKTKQAIAKLQAQIDSVKKTDSVTSH
jgi:hypothetical protein